MSVSGAYSKQGRYKECLQSGTYDKVSPGEVCTLATAKKLGIYDPKNYFVQDGNYTSLQTFRPAVDAAERRTEQICTEGPKGAVYYPACAVEHGVGMVRKPGSESMCTTYGCPPGFRWERGACTKPLEDATLTQQAFCDERWYDWYTIPNYHLGNRYLPGSNVGQCYQPCNPGFVPNISTDPSDGSSLDLFSTDQPEQCVPKSEFFFGKYRGTSDYCPLAWIHRVGMLPSDISDSLSNVYSAALQTSGGVPNDRWHSLMNGRGPLSEKLARMSGAFLQNVEVPTASVLGACSAPEYRTEDRLRGAYRVCRDIQKDEEGFAKRLGAELGDSAAVQSNKVTLLKQACNALFCNPSDESVNILGEEPICFPEVQALAPVPEEGEEKPMDPPTLKPGIQFVKRMAKTSLTIVFVILIGIVVLGILWLLSKATHWVWNREGISGRKIWDAIRRFFGKPVITESDQTRRLLAMVEEKVQKIMDEANLAEMMKKS